MNQEICVESSSTVEPTSSVSSAKPKDYKPLSYQQFLSKFKARLEKLARRVTIHGGDFEDALQEIHVKVWKLYAYPLENEKKRVGFVLSSLRRYVLDLIDGHISKYGKEQVASSLPQDSEGERDSGMTNLLEHSCGIEDQLEARDSLMRLHRCVEMIPRTERIRRWVLKLVLNPDPEFLTFCQHNASNFSELGSASEIASYISSHADGEKVPVNLVRRYLQDAGSIVQQQDSNANYLLPFEGASSTLANKTTNRPKRLMKTTSAKPIVAETTVESVTTEDDFEMQEIALEMLPDSIYLDVVSVKEAIVIVDEPCHLEATVEVVAEQQESDNDNEAIVHDVEFTEVRVVSPENVISGSAINPMDDSDKDHGYMGWERVWETYLANMELFAEVADFGGIANGGIIQECALPCISESVTELTHSVVLEPRCRIPLPFAFSPPKPKRKKGNKAIVKRSKPRKPVDESFDLFAIVFGEGIAGDIGRQ